MPSNKYDLQGPLPTEDEVRDWIFTFGCGQEHAGHYRVINGTFDEARHKMVHMHGNQWSMQYRTKEEAGVEIWKLKELV